MGLNVSSMGKALAIRFKGDRLMGLLKRPRKRNISNLSFPVDCQKRIDNAVVLIRDCWILLERLTVMRGMLNKQHGAYEQRLQYHANILNLNMSFMANCLLNGFSCRRFGEDELDQLYCKVLSCF